MATGTTPSTRAADESDLFTYCLTTPYYSSSSTHADVLARGPFRGHPLTGPVSIKGARRGDVLTIEILDVKPAAAFGWTAIRPGRGLLPEAGTRSPAGGRLLEAAFDDLGPQ